MPNARVLIVDDSVVIRRLLTKVLEGEDGIDVAGIAQNGKIALAKLPQVNPDLVILDIEMPELDGLSTLKELRKDYPRLPVIMFSTLTQRGATSTLDALSSGANDYVTKPEGAGSMSEALQTVREQIVPKIRSLCGLTKVSAPVRRKAPAPAGAKPAIRKPRGPASPARAVVIAVSTGGPNALAEVIPRLPARLPIPVLVVQHMPPMFTKLLAERLDAKSAVTVRECQGSEIVTPGTVWIAPGDHHMTAHQTPAGVQLRLNQEPPENSCRPAADVLFRSAAPVWKSNLLGVVLTGMGQDGFRGSECVIEAGGSVIAQDEATSVVWGMPGYVAREGLADRVLPLDEIAAEIERRIDPLSSLLGRKAAAATSA